MKYISLNIGIISGENIDTNEITDIIDAYIRERGGCCVTASTSYVNNIIYQDRAYRGTNTDELANFFFGLSDGESIHFGITSPKSTFGKYESVLCRQVSDKGDMPKIEFIPLTAIPLINKSLNMNLLLIFNGSHLVCSCNVNDECCSAGLLEKKLCNVLSGDLYISTELDHVYMPDID